MRQEVVMSISVSFLIRSYPVCPNVFVTQRMRVSTSNRRKMENQFKSKICTPATWLPLSVALPVQRGIACPCTAVNASVYPLTVYVPNS